MINNLPVLNPDAGVILVASGYLFRCPECDDISYCASALEPKVTCDNCRAEFLVVEVRHRTRDLDLAPGVPPGALFIPKKAENHPADEPPDTSPRRRKGKGKQQVDR